jgi:hypothetical protein
LFPFICFLVPGRLTTKEDVFPSRLQRESKLFEKKEKTNTFSPSAVQRETVIDIVDPVVLIFPGTLQ